MGEARKAGLMVGAVLCGAMIAIAAATAGAGIKTVSKSTTIEAGELGRATAKCKGGRRPISAGFSAERVPTGILVPAIYPTSSDLNVGGSWGISGRNAGGEEGTLTAFAYCAKGKLKPRGSGFIDADGGEAVSDIAKCHKGQRVVSGGWGQFNGDYQIIIHESRKVGKRKWSVSGYNYGELGVFDVTAHCKEGGRQLKTRSKTVTIDEGLEIGTVTPRCPKGSRAVSGGFDNPSFDASAANQTQAPIAESRRVGGRGWTASATSMLGPATFTGYVYCERK